MARSWEHLDTLADLDAKAASLPQARSWLTYPYFMIARYPRLRPAKDGQQFSRTLQNWEKKIASHADAKRALENLTPALREQLAALLLDVIADLEMYRGKIARPKKTFIKLADRRARMLKRKRGIARRALDDLQTYATTRDPLLESEDEEAARSCLKILDGIRDVDFATRLNDVTSLHPLAEDPLALGMVRLYWFFRSACELAGDEAEIRVALLRNSFWRRLGVPTIEFQATYQPGESKGCSAVHEAVRRFRPPQGTPK
jgi:hypothetical protein